MSRGLILAFRYCTAHKFLDEGGACATQVPVWFSFACRRRHTFRDGPYGVRAGCHVPPLRCQGPCGTGVLVRSQKTAGGTGGIFISLLRLRSERSVPSASHSTHKAGFSRATPCAPSEVSFACRYCPFQPQRRWLHHGRDRRQNHRLRSLRSLRGIARSAFQRCGMA